MWDLNQNNFYKITILLNEKLMLNKNPTYLFQNYFVFRVYKNEVRVAAVDVSVALVTDMQLVAIQIIRRRNVTRSFFTFLKHKL